MARIHVCASPVTPCDNVYRESPCESNITDSKSKQYCSRSARRRFRLKRTAILASKVGSVEIRGMMGLQPAEGRPDSSTQCNFGNNADMRANSDRRLHLESSAEFRLAAIEFKLDLILGHGGLWNEDWHPGWSNWATERTEVGVPAEVLKKQCSSARVIQKAWREQSRKRLANMTPFGELQCLGCWEPLPLHSFCPADHVCAECKFGSISVSATCGSKKAGTASALVECGAEDAHTEIGFQNTERIENEAVEIPSSSIHHYLKQQQELDDLILDMCPNFANYEIESQFRFLVEIEKALLSTGSDKYTIQAVRDKISCTKRFLDKRDGVV